MKPEDFAVVIVGAGQAGGRAAKTLRDAGFAGSITLVGAEQHLPYERPPLSKDFLTSPSRHRTEVFDLQYVSQHKLTLALGREAIAVDRARKCVSLDDGTQLKYDALLITTGCRVRTIEVPGYPIVDIYYLRTIEHADALQSRLVSGCRIAIVGGGFIGLEVAASAIACGCAVTVLETARQLLPRLNSPEASAFVLHHHRAAGIDVRLDSRIISAEDHTLRLNDGSTIVADIIVAGIGVTPNDALAAEAGLEVDDGILTDETGRTSDPAIFAAGDVTRQLHPGIGRRLRLESWQNANIQAEIAARAIIGSATPQNHVPWVWSDQGALNLQVAGAPDQVDRTIIREYAAPDEGITIFQLLGDRLVGGLTLNRAKDMPLIRRILSDSDLKLYPERLADSFDSITPGNQSKGTRMNGTVTILVATMSGTAEMVADAMLPKIGEAGLKGKILRMEKIRPDSLAADGAYIICSSTYGTGEVPDNGKAFFAALESGRPDLSGLQYGVIALGDSIYPNTYCNGGKLFDKLFTSLGATRLGPLLEHDCRGAVYPEDAACNWIEDWLNLIQ